jgi:hypothetical protein
VTRGALERSLELATLLGLCRPANDNSRPARSAPATRLAVRSRQEHLVSCHAEHLRQPAEKRNREMGARLDALDRRQVNTDMLSELRLAPVPGET